MNSERNLGRKLEEVKEEEFEVHHIDDLIEKEVKESEPRFNQIPEE